MLHFICNGSWDFDDRYVDIKNSHAHNSPKIKNSCSWIFIHWFLELPHFRFEKTRDPRKVDRQASVFLVRLLGCKYLMKRE